MKFLGLTSRHKVLGGLRLGRWLPMTWRFAGFTASAQPNDATCLHTARTAKILSYSTGQGKPGTMCLFKSPKPPEVKPLPVTPTIDDDAVRKREQQQAALLAARSGTAGTVKTDLAPTDVAGAQKRVMLGV